MIDRDAPGSPLSGAPDDDSPQKRKIVGPDSADSGVFQSGMSADLDEAEKREVEEKLKVTGWQYVKRLLHPVSAEDRRVFAVIGSYMRPHLAKVILSVMLSIIGGSLAAFQLSWMQAGISTISPQDPASKHKELKFGTLDKVVRTVTRWFGGHDAPVDPILDPNNPNAQPEPAPALTKDQRKVNLRAVVFGFVALALLTALLDYIREIMMATVSRKMIRDMRDDCFKTLVRLPLQFHQTQHSSRILSRLTKDITRLRQMFISISLGMVTEVCVFAAALWYTISHLGWIAVMGIAMVLLALVPIRIIGDRLRFRDKQSEAGEADLFAIVSEAIIGQKMVKAFTAEKHEIKRFRVAARSTYKRQMETYRLRAVSEPIVELIGDMTIGVGILVLGKFVIDGRDGMTIPVLTTVLFAMQKLNRSVSHLAKYQNDFVRGISAGEKIVGLLDQTPEIPDAPNAIPLERFDDKIEYHDVKFSYHRGSRALRGLSLTIRKGETVAIVGPSGAGKTSLVDMLPRFYDPNKGSVTIDGKDIREYTLKSLRQMIGIVSQETILFSDTLAENIAYGLKDISRERIIEAAKAACAHDFIMAKDQGYDTELGERGLSLSGGERQRIAIARAILKNPPILILDEATSALDAESEAHVQKALDNLMVGRTTIVIAHRLSTIRRANHIVVIQRGVVEEEGTHDELMAKNGLYARAFSLQMEAMLRGESQATIDKFFRRDDE